VSTAPLVKICGITRAGDGIDALTAGADAIGVVLAASSPRSVAPSAAGALVAAIRTGAGERPFLAVAVLDALDPAAARDALDERGFDRVQFHSTADLPALAALLDAFPEARERAWGAVRVAEAASLDGAGELACEAVLLDAHVPGEAGGTGRTFRWELAAPLAAARRVVLAGGLHPGNVSGAIDVVRPWMVDVSSGVEAAPGIKDPARMRAFVEAVRA
jgi:phosphoribosylanthranilate isomerase